MPITLFTIFKNTKIRRNIQAHLHGSDLIQLRRVHSKLRKALKNQSIPYESRLHFNLAFVTLLDDKKSKIDKNFMRMLIKQYTSCVSQSENKKPALIYRLSELDNFKYVNRSRNKSQQYLVFCDGDNLMDTSRIYSFVGSNHSWLQNLIWLTAQISIKRPFYIYSEINQINFRRSTKLSEYSAFGREIAFVLKAKYKVDFFLNPITDNLDIMLLPTDKTPNEIDVTKLNPTNEDIQDTYKIMKSFKDGLDFGLDILWHFDEFYNTHDPSQLDFFINNSLAESGEKEIEQSPDPKHFIDSVINLFEKTGYTNFFDLNNEMSPLEFSNNIKKGIKDALQFIVEKMKQEQQEKQNSKSLKF